MGIVWILGAGFSRPLGGPLLGKLLSPESERDLHIRYSKMPQLWTPQANAARWLYRYGRNEPAPVGAGSFIKGENLWEDAEQYLDYLDTAAEKGAGSPACDRLLEILGDPKVVNLLRLQLGAAMLIPMAAAARRLLSAELQLVPRRNGSQLSALVSVPTVVPRNIRLGRRYRGDVQLRPCAGDACRGATAAGILSVSHE